jgi:secondary thiamine-phosphate synthase enzyme
MIRGGADVVRTFELSRETTGETDIVDLSREVRSNLEHTGIKNGITVVHVPGSTGAVTTIEYEPGVVRDLEQAIERMAPRDMHYDHDAAWGDGNGHSHVRAALCGPSLTVPVVDGALCLGTWQQIVLLDFDNRPRSRRIVQQVIGEE